MGKVLIIIGAIIAWLTYGWWYNELGSSLLGAQATQLAFQCILNGGTGDCHNLWLVGLHETNQFASMFFYIGLLIAGSGILISVRGINSTPNLIRDLGISFVTVVFIVFLAGILQHIAYKHEAAQEAMHQQQVQELKAQQQALQREQENEQNLEINIPKIIAKMEDINGKIDNDLNKFPAIEQKYQSITAKVQAHYDSARGYYSRNLYAVGQIEYVMNQGRYATDQVHYQIMSINNSFNSGVGALMHTISTYENSCETTNSLNPDVKDLCQKLADAVPPFKTKVRAMTDALQNLEQVYKTEYSKQGDLVMALQHNQYP